MFGGRSNIVEWSRGEPESRRGQPTDPGEVGRKFFEKWESSGCNKKAHRWYASFCLSLTFRFIFGTFRSGGVARFVLRIINLSQAEVGDTFIDGAFLSTACHRDKGFGGSINMIILIPKGAQGIFAEPFTHYNAGYYDYQTRIWNGTEKVGLGGEFEWIGQRGSRFKVIRKSGKNLYLMLIGQQFTQPTGMTK